MCCIVCMVGTNSNTQAAHFHDHKLHKHVGHMLHLAADLPHHLRPLFTMLEVYNAKHTLPQAQAAPRWLHLHLATAMQHVAHTSSSKLQCMQCTTACPTCEPGCESVWLACCMPCESTGLSLIGLAYACTRACALCKAS